jgi:hypothetical protein
MVFACSSSGSSSNGASSGGPTDGGGDDASTDAGSDAKGDASGADAGPCGAGANKGAVVDVTQIAQPAPAATGGVVADGTYLLTSATMYTGTGGATGPLGLSLQQTWGYAAGAYHWVSKDSSTNTEARAGGTVATVSAISLHLLQTCPTSDFASYEYSSDGTTWTLFSTDGQGTLATTLTRQ